MRTMKWFISSLMLLLYAGIPVSYMTQGIQQANGAIAMSIVSLLIGAYCLHKEKKLHENIYGRYKNMFDKMFHGYAG
jgi:hypothetical protein